MIRQYILHFCSIAQIALKMKHTVLLCLSSFVLLLVLCECTVDARNGHEQRVKRAGIYQLDCLFVCTLTLSCLKQRHHYTWNIQVIREHLRPASSSLLYSYILSRPTHGHDLIGYREWSCIIKRRSFALWEDHLLKALHMSSLH